MTRRTRRIIFHTFSALVLAVSVLICILCFRGVFWRTWEVVRDYGLSVAYFFTHLFAPDLITPTVTTLPRDFFEGIPEAWEQFVPIAKAFGTQFIAKENFFAYLGKLLIGLSRFALVLSFLLPFLMLGVVLVWLFLKKENTDHGKNSKPLELYLAFRRKIVLPIKSFVLAYVGFLKRHKAYMIALLCIWMYTFNTFTIVVELFAFVFYFAASFDLKGIFVMLAKLVSDLMPMFRFVPLWLWGIVGIVILVKLRGKLGYAKLDKYEKDNREFAKSLPIVTMLTGSMRKKKTTIITDIALSMQEVFREQAHDDMREIEMKFRHFPWQSFEQFLKRNIRKGTLPTQASIKTLLTMFECSSGWDRVTQKAFRRWARSRFGYAYSDLCFGYDVSYGLIYNNAAVQEKLFDLLIAYGRLYYIYTNPTQIISNYGLRSDKNLQDEGNFPIWKDDFFRVPPADPKKSEMSHILNYNMLRLGCKTEKNPYQDSAESAVFCLTEIGKERGNQNDLKGLSKYDEGANQVNDLFNTELKMIGHSATVYYYPYVRFLCDDQRPESWGADARELCDIVDIVEGGKKKIILPFFALEEALYLISSKLFGKLYDHYRFRRGDNTLTMYFLKWLHGTIFNHYTRIQNTFSVATAKLTVQAGTMDEKKQKCKYYLCTKKIYADRFSTDCYSGFYERKSVRSTFGIRDIPQYAATKPTYDELQAQGSYFINGITKAFEGDLSAFQKRGEKPKK